MTYGRCCVHIKQALISPNQKVRYGKIVEDNPLSFQEFFQIRQT